MKWNKPGVLRGAITGGAINPDPLGEPEGEVFNPDQLDVRGLLVNLAKDGMALLHKHYPGWRWAIQINQFGGMMNIFNLHLHDTWGYAIRIIEAERDPSRSVFVKAGGEILERFKMPRAGISLSRVLDMKRDHLGRGIPHLSDLEHASAKRMRRQKQISEALMAGRVRVNPLTKAIEVGLIENG
jgi:hypothetical protein